MKGVRRILYDIRNGENIDVYITILLAIILSIMNLTGAFPTRPELINSLTLALLGLLAISNLANRHILEESSRKAYTYNEVFLENLPQPEFGRDFELAEDLLMVGVTLTTTIRRGYYVMERKLRKGHKIRVLLVNPESTAVPMADRRERGSGERTKQEIYIALQDLNELQKIAPTKLIIHTISHPLSFGAIAMNIETIAGTIYIQHYPYKVPGGSRPKFVLHARDEKWYGFFKQEIESLWNDSQEWKGVVRLPHNPS